MSSPARSGSVLVAPTKVRDGVATKKKFSIPGGGRRGPPAPGSGRRGPPAEGGGLVPRSPAGLGRAVSFAGRAAPAEGVCPAAPDPAPVPGSRPAAQCGRIAPSTSRAISVVVSRL